MFGLGKLFQPCVMFASKVGAYLSEVSFRCSTQGYAPAKKISEDLKVKDLALFILFYYHGFLG